MEYLNVLYQQYNICHYQYYQFLSLTKYLNINLILLNQDIHIIYFLHHVTLLDILLVFYF